MVLTLGYSDRFFRIAKWDGQGQRLRQEGRKREGEKERERGPELQRVEPKGVAGRPAQAGRGGSAKIFMGRLEADPKQTQKFQRFIFLFL